jgi:hypothetical protein
MNLQRTNFSINWDGSKLNTTRRGNYAGLQRKNHPGPRAWEAEDLGQAI